MRPELEFFERIDQYLTGVMSAGEREHFETDLLTDSTLANALETQQLLIEAVKRKALLAQVEQYAPSRPGGGSALSRFSWLVLLASLLVAGTITGILIQTGDAEHDTSSDAETTSVQPVSGNPAHTKEEQESESTSAASSGQNEVLRTRMVRVEGKLFGGLRPWITPQVQWVEINPAMEQLVECAEGTLIVIPENAFENTDGSAVNGTVRLEIIEALTMDKMIGYNLTTMNGDNALQSGGMVYVQPVQDGQELRLAHGKALHIEIPTFAYDPSMMAWKGVPDGNGNLNWESPQPLENYLTTVDLASLDFLPEGFRGEVQRSLPFRKYTSSSRQLEDSLYYALGSGVSSVQNAESEARIVDPKPSKKGEIAVSSGNEEIPVTVTGTGRRRSGQDVRVRDKEGGVAGIEFTDLQPGVNYQCILFYKDRTFDINLVNGRASVDFTGKASALLYVENCGEWQFDNIELSADKISFVNAGKARCKNTPEIIGAKGVDSCRACIIDPSSVFAIQQKEFANTFIATREFQERLQALHRIPDAQQYFDRYVNQLNRNLYEIDAQIAAALTGENKALFERFAAEKLTNVKPADQNYEALKKYYSGQVRQQQETVRRQQEEYSRKTEEELQALAGEYRNIRERLQQDQTLIEERFSTGLSGVFSQNGGVQGGSAQVTQKIRNTRPVVGQQAAYKVNWFATGWVNIDAYLKQLSKGERILPVAVKEGGSDRKIYQSVNSLSTLVPLNVKNNRYEAHFPKAFNATFAQSLVLGVEKKAEKVFALAVEEFNPYEQKDVTLKGWQEMSETEFKQTLTELYPVGKGLIDYMELEERRLQEAIERQKKLEALRQERDAGLEQARREYEESKAVLDRKQQDILERQRKEQAFMEHLRNTIDPCKQGSSSVNPQIEETLKDNTNTFEI